MGKNNIQTYNFAKSFLGKGGATFRKYCGLPSGAAWCNAFVTYVFQKTDNAGLYCNGKKETYCPHSIQWCKKNLAQLPLYLAMPMDVIYFDWDRNGVPNHIGFVRDHKDTASIYTIEGNTDGGKVANKTRPAKYVQAVFRPHFKPTEAYKGTPLAIDGVLSWQSIYALQKALGGISVDGVLGIATVKRLQQYVAAERDGSWQAGTSRAVQKMLRANGYYKGEIDGAFGKESVKGLQRFCNAKNKAKPTPAPTPKPTPKPPTKKGYSGTFPTLPTATAKNAASFAYAYGTKLSVYKYHGGKPKGNYKTALNKMYPDRRKWGAKAKAGASCDVFVGTVLRSSGYKKAPRGLKEQKKWLPKNLTRVSTIRNGDILLRSNHVAVFLELKGGKYVANAHHEKHDGTYGIVEKLCKYERAYRTSGVSYFSKGDTFTEVKNLQKFLNWYGGYKLAEDYVYGTATENAVKDFQKKNGLSVTGKFTATDLKKAKAIKK